AEVVHALGGIPRELVVAARRAQVAQLLWDGHDVVARHHHPLAALVLAPPLGQHRFEAGPRFGGRMLRAELPLAVAPAAQGDDRADPLVDAAGVDGHGRAEARAQHADTLGVDAWQRL